MLSGKNVFHMSAAVFLLSAVLCQAGNRSEQSDMEGELVWSQWDELRHEIYASSYRKGTWSDPVKITDNNANNLHPALDVAPGGDKWLFWSAIRPNGISIEYAVNRDGIWSEPIKMKLDYSSAITPSVLINDGTVWLVWAGNDGGRDEIYYSRSAGGSSWSKAKTVNKVNEVPDIKSELSLNDQGQVEVQWYGFRDGTYKLLTSSYTAGGWSPEQEAAEEQEEKSEEEILKESGIELPECMPKNSQYFLKITAGIPGKKAE